MMPTSRYPDTEVEKPETGEAEKHEAEEDEVEERIDMNTEDSFPASDPPSWSPTVSGPPPKKPRKSDPIV